MIISISLSWRSGTKVEPLSEDEGVGEEAVKKSRLPALSTLLLADADQSLAVALAKLSLTAGVSKWVEILSELPALLGCCCLCWQRAG